MTAFDLIDSIFSHVQAGVPGNERRITERQLDYLEELIGEDPEGAAYVSDGPGRKIWKPSGRTKFVIMRDGPTTHRCVQKLSNLAASGTGSLF
jgi:hypothetical protein